MNMFLMTNRYNRMDKIGYQPLEDMPYRYSLDYLHVEVPLYQIIKATSEAKIYDVAKAGTRLKLLPGAKLDIKVGYRVEIHPNPELYKLGDVQYTSLLGNGDEGEFLFYFKPYKDFDGSEIKYLARLYVHGE